MLNMDQIETKQEDINAMVNMISPIIEHFSGLIDEDNLLATILGFCYAIGEARGFRPKDFKHRLKDIIFFKERI